jgi:hypothetical protein
MNLQEIELPTDLQTSLDLDLMSAMTIKHIPLQQRKSFAKQTLQDKFQHNEQQFTPLINGAYNDIAEMRPTSANSLVGHAQKQSEMALKINSIKCNWKRYFIHLHWNSGGLRLIPIGIVGNSKCEQSSLPLLPGTTSRSVWY